jgi:sucrose phosphorylase
MKNQVHLITYVDRIEPKGLQGLQKLLTDKLKDVFGGVHLLPFFYPIDGADAGFDSIDHTVVDRRLGTWDDIKELSQTTDVMADVIVNHVSAQSPQFLDYLAKGEKSDYANLFLTMDSVFPNGATEKELLTIYRPRPGMPFTTISLKNSEKKMFWTTFTSNQIDIDVKSEAGIAYLESILKRFYESGIKMIRLDAAGYAIKKAGTSCFMIPETFEFINWFRNSAKTMGIEVLVEIHSYYKKQIEIAKQVDWVYDFALPPLILHAIFNKTSAYLKKWLEISPRNAITVLDTHDGIGVIDIGGYLGEKGLIPDEDIDRLVEQIHKNSRGESKQATGAAASNLDLYQVNCTYFDALGCNENKYLLARAIQFFSPGVPQVYYVGLLGEKNDMELLHKTQVGRDINRHYFIGNELDNALDRPIVKRLINLVKFRNSYAAFNGNFSIITSNSEKLILVWDKGIDKATLTIDFSKLDFIISYTENGFEKILVI